MKMLFATASALPIMLAAIPVAAQTSQGTTAGETVSKADEEILVIASRYVPEGAITATKTDTPLIEVPQSVSVVTRDQIDLLGFIDLQQSLRYVAGAVGENYGPDLRFDFVTIRGFTPVQYVDGLQAPVSASISNIGLDLYGAQSVDILKGPAATLYGSTPPGGIYNITTRRPESAPDGELKVKYGTQDFKQVAGTLTGAITNGIDARVTGLYRNRGSQTDFVEQDRVYIAPAIAVAIGPDTQLTGLGYYQYDRVDADTNGFLPLQGTLLDNPLGELDRSINLGEPDINTYRRNQFAAGYEFKHDFGTLEFVQNVRWSEYHEDQRTVYTTGLASDNRTATRADFPFRDDTSQFAADSRLTGILVEGDITHKFLAGVDYRNYREASAFSFLGATPIDIFAPVYGTYDAPADPAFFDFTDQRLRQTGIYLQNQSRIGKFILTLNGRQDFIDLDDRLTDTSTSQDKFTYRIGASYQSDGGIAPYVSYATSFQPVVGNDRNGNGFVPTSGRQFETGIKYDGANLGDDVALFATAAYYNLRQTNVVTPDPDQTSFPGANVQTGEVDVDGVELEVVTRIRDQLSVNASYTYTDARVTRSNVAGQEGAELPFQPKHKVSLFVDYSFIDGPLAGFGLGGGARYLADSPGSLPGPFNPIIYDTGPSALFDAIMRYDTSDWRFAVNGTNLLDKRYLARCSPSCFFGPERQVIATVTRKF